MPALHADEMSASKLINYFSSHSAVFGFWASLPPDNSTLSDFQTGIGADGHAASDTEQLIYNTRTALVDTIGSL